MNRTTSFPRLPIRPGDDPIVSHAGARVLPDLADALGMTAGLSAAGDGMKPRQRGHDRGLVLVNLAAVMDGGATSLSDRELFIRQPDVLGSGAPVPTTWRTLQVLDDAVAARLATARAASHASCKI